MRKNGQRSKSSKRKPRNGTSKKQKEHVNDDVAGTGVKMEAIKELATEPQPGKSKQTKQSSSSSKALSTALALEELLANMSDTDSESDSDSDSVAELKQGNALERWTKISETGLKHETKDGMMKKYIMPKSLSPLTAPVLNPEIAELLPEEAINFDNLVVEKQNGLAAAVAATMQAMEGALSKKMKQSEIIKLVNDAGMLLADTHFTYTRQRREAQRMIALINGTNFVDE